MYRIILLSAFIVTTVNINAQDYTIDLTTRYGNTYFIVKDIIFSTKGKIIDTYNNTEEIIDVCHIINICNNVKSTTGNSDNNQKRINKIGFSEVHYGIDGNIDRIGSMDISYDIHGRVNEIGSETVSYDINNRIDKIGSTDISYDLHDRIDKIGSVIISYNIGGNISRIGSTDISYDIDGKVDKIGDKYISYDIDGKLKEIDNL
jgi:hypothetical protein